MMELVLLMTGLAGWLAGQWLWLCICVVQNKYNTIWYCRGTLSEQFYSWGYQMMYCNNKSNNALINPFWLWRVILFKEKGLEIINPFFQLSITSKNKQPLYRKALICLFGVSEISENLKNTASEWIPWYTLKEWKCTISDCPLSSFQRKTEYKLNETTKNHEERGMNECNLTPKGPTYARQPALISCYCRPCNFPNMKIWQYRKTRQLYR